MQEVGPLQIGLSPAQERSKEVQKKKTMMATWSDSDDSITDKESHEEANLCLMAHENEVTSETQNKFFYDELQEAFYELLDDLKKLRIKNKDLKLRNQVLAKEKEEVDSRNKELEIKNQSLLKEKDKISNLNKTLTKENQDLKEEVAKLKPIVDRFTLSSNKLQMIIDRQKAVYDKVGLGYNTL